MSDFVKEIHNMFDHIWDCEIDHPVYQDTVGELMEAVIQTYEKHKPTLSTNLASLGTDLISRQAAIDALKGLEFCQYMEFGEYIGEDTREVRLIRAEKARDTLQDLPSAQPETHEERTETHGVCLDVIDRQAAIDAHYEYCNKHPDAGFPIWSLKILEDLPSAQPDLSEYSDKLWKAAYERGKAEALDEIVRCKDCKHWKDSDGVYRRGIGAESKCPVNIRAVYEGNFYCADAERRSDEGD